MARDHLILLAVLVAALLLAVADLARIGAGPEGSGVVHAGTHAAPDPMGALDPIRARAQREQPAASGRAVAGREADEPPGSLP